MSTRSGEQGNKKKGRSQKHQNTFKFRLDEKDKKIQKLLATPKDHLCQRCFDQITWKIEYKKYKALTTPGRCNDCKQKSVFKAYRALCDACADKHVQVVCTPQMQKELNMMSNFVEKKEQEALEKQKGKPAATGTDEEAKASKDALSEHSSEDVEDAEHSAGSSDSEVGDKDQIEEGAT